MSPALRTARQDSFSRGMNDAAAPEEYRASEVARLFDGRLQLAGNGAKRRSGSKRTHPSALGSGATVYGLVEFTTGSGTTQLLAFVGDTLYTSTDGGATWTSQQTGLDEAAWDFAVTDVCGTPEVIAANGDTSVYRWDGSTWNTLTGAPSGVKYLAVYHNRLYVAGHNEETVQASAVSDFDEWGVANGALNFKAGIHDGDPVIRALYQLGPYLLIFKRNSVGYAEGYGFETLNVESGAEGISRSVGCRGFRTVQGTGSEAVVWLSERGLEHLSPGSGIQLIGRSLQATFDGLDHAAMDTTPALPTSVYWERKNEYWLAVPLAGSTNNDRIVVWRPPGGGTSPAFYQFRPSFDVATLAMATPSSGPRVPFAAGYDGFVRETETGDLDDRNSDGTAGRQVKMELRTRPLTYGAQSVYKRARVTRLSASTEKASTLSVAPIADGVVGEARSVAFEATRGIETHKARVNARGHVLGVEVTTPSTAVLQGVTLEAKPLRRGW